MAPDPYRYFRIEARELLEGMNRDILEAERGGRSAELVGGLLRRAHTLKGAARVVRHQSIADLAHALEDLLAAFRDATGPLPRVRIEEMLRVADRISAEVAGLEPASRPAAEEAVDFVRVGVEELESLTADLSDATQAGDDVEGVRRHLRRARDTVHRLRLVPASAAFPALERAVRDAAASQAKQADLTMSGGENRLEAHVLGLLRDSLLHLVRNAVAHGIEAPAERVSIGKPASGRIELRVEQRGDRIAVTCRDDGRGVDSEAVHRRAQERGIQATDLQEILLKGGISTTRAVTELSGRGVGLAVVRDSVARLKGEAAIRTEAGVGTTVELSVPISLSSLHCLAGECGGRVVWIPIRGIEEVRRLAPDDVVIRDGRELPQTSLAALMGWATAPPSRWSVLIVRAGDDTVAIGVDRILRASPVDLKAVPIPIPMVAGAVLDPSGEPQLILDLAALADAVRGGSGAIPPSPAMESKRVLVVDDSLTTQMLERGILESAGYEVEVAGSGEEALSRAQERGFDVVLVDVEMPGMDGFELMERMGADPALASIPRVVVTSRGSDEDRRRASRLGARGYIVKGEFNQQDLLERLRAVLEGA